MPSYAVHIRKSEHAYVPTMCAGVSCIETSNDCLQNMVAAQGNPTCGSDIVFYMEINAMLHIKSFASYVEAANKSCLVNAYMCIVFDLKYEDSVVLGCQGEVHACGSAAWSCCGSPWLSFTAAGPTPGAWKRVQLGKALCIRDRPGGGPRLS